VHGTGPIGAGVGRSRAVGIAAFAVSLALYLASAAVLPLYDKGEPREALVVRAVLQHHEVVLPRAGGRIPSKPPLFHWLAALGVGAGIRPEELALRLPSAVFGAAGVGITAAVAAAGWGVPAGVLSAAVLGSSFEWLRAATQARVDMTFTVLVLLAILAFAAGTAAAGRRRLVVAGWLFAALAVLTKGPAGIVLPLLVVAADGWRRPDRRRLVRVLDGGGIALAAALVAGWYAIAWHDGGRAFVGRQIVAENLQRYVGWGHVPHRASILYYPPVLAGAFLPWTLALPAALGRAWRDRAGALRLASVWCLVVFGFFSLAAGKRSVYLLPLFPPLAVLTGVALAEGFAVPGRLGLRRVLVGTAALVAAAAAAVTVLPPLGRAADVLGGLVPGSDASRIPAVLAALDGERLGIVVGLAAVALALAALAYGGGRPRWSAAAVVALALLWSGGLTFAGTRPVALALTTRPAALRLRALVGDGVRLCARTPVDRVFRYYAARPIPPCQRRALRPATTYVLAETPPGDDGRRHFRLTRERAGAPPEDVAIDLADATIARASIDGGP
jgi:4-amino-4-deoxy-L-arabinose transferase-like glycosyltransferase